MKAGRETLCAGMDILNARDVERLLLGYWLNDSLINGFTSLFDDELQKT